MSKGIAVARLLRDPQSAGHVEVAHWAGLLTAARALSLIGTLAERLRGIALPEGVERVLEDVRLANLAGRRQALWEAECARVALSNYCGRVVLMKGTAYVAAGLDAGTGRSIGDLDIMVARNDLPEVESALLAAGWEWVRPDPYDDLYYRTWMHELPPMIHRTRDRMIDVHHTILPLTARPKPDAAALLSDAERLPSGLYIFSPADMVCHAVAHLIADGDMGGGMRNLWDIDRLVRDFAERDPDVWAALAARARMHGLESQLARALRLAGTLYGTPAPDPIAGRPRPGDQLFLARVTAVNGWGQKTRRQLRRGFYVRSHLLRMPPAMLARHLFVKWRKGHKIQ